MRTLIKIALTTALALGVSSSASALMNMSLSQVGGTYNAGVGASNGDTLLLSIDYSFTGGTTISSAAAAINIAGLATLDVPGSSETGTVFWNATTAAPLVTGDYATVGGNAIGWEKANTTGNVWGGAGPCTPLSAGNECTSLGVISLVLTGTGGVLDLAATVGQAGGTAVFLTPGGTNDAALQNIGTFTIIPIPEPTTASLLGLGLLGLTIAGRSRKN